VPLISRDSPPRATPDWPHLILVRARSREERGGSCSYARGKGGKRSTAAPGGAFFATACTLAHSRASAILNARQRLLSYPTTGTRTLRIIALIARSRSIPIRTILVPFTDSMRYRDCEPRAENGSQRRDVGDTSFPRTTRGNETAAIPRRCECGSVRSSISIRTLLRMKSSQLSRDTKGTAKCDSESVERLDPRRRVCAMNRGIICEDI